MEDADRSDPGSRESHAGGHINDHSSASLPVVPRWIGAVLCIVYGFAKLSGSQFSVLDSEISRPLGEVSGFWLTWYYFGYSWAYGSLLAVLQIAAGVMLVIPRMALAGALMLLPIVTNIVLIDLFYGVDANWGIIARIPQGARPEGRAPIPTWWSGLAASAGKRAASSQKRQHH